MPFTAAPRLVAFLGELLPDGPEGQRGTVGGPQPSQVSCKGRQGCSPLPLLARELVESINELDRLVHALLL